MNEFKGRALVMIILTPLTDEVKTFSEEHDKVGINDLINSQKIEIETY